MSCLQEIRIQVEKTRSKTQKKLYKKNFYNKKKLQQDLCIMEFQITKSEVISNHTT